MSVKSYISKDGNTPTPEMEEPKLAPPGAGLPFIEWAVGNFIVVPQRLRTVTVPAAIEEFAAISRAIEASAKPLNEAQLSTRRLIPRLRGLEDSSRFWSVAMAMEHTIIVNKRIRGLVIALTNGKNSFPASSTADVKPPKDIDCRKIMHDFLESVQSYQDTVARADFDKFAQTKFAHPWFGQMTAKQWVQFIPMHQQIHKKQIEEIIKRL